jgi:hypothetical protein
MLYTDEGPAGTIGGRESGWRMYGLLKELFTWPLRHSRRPRSLATASVSIKIACLGDSDRARIPVVHAARTSN